MRRYNEHWLKASVVLLWARLVLFIVFCTFGFAAIIINAVNRETEEYQKGQDDKRMDLVLTDITNIQGALSPKAESMTEAERQRRLLDSLRDEYVIEQKSVDPQILAGNKRELFNSRDIPTFRKLRYARLHPLLHRFLRRG